MKGLSVLLAFALSCGGAAQAASLTPKPCPDKLQAETHRAACSRFASETVAFDVAVFSPRAGKSKGHIVYIPGGPGEAPVRDGPPEDLFTYLRGHTLVSFDPRGLAGSTPAMTCDLGDRVWNEDYPAEDAIAALRPCRERMLSEDIDPATITSQAIAGDISMLVQAMGIDRAGLFGISYGTEPALHLLAEAPEWLDFAVLDSVSVPGISGIEEERAARDRFLATLDRRCFAKGACSKLAQGGADDLTAWAAQFDDDPLEFSLSKGGDWSFDGTEMLDYLGTLGTYVDGLDIGIELIELLATSRLRALGWIRADLEGAIEFGEEALPLMLQAYSDTFAPEDFDTITLPSRYATDIEDARIQLELQRFWRGEAAREARFIAEDAVPETREARILILSGGIDPATPLEWAAALERRFAGMDRWVFPLLGHAVSLGNAGWVKNDDVAVQMRCANRVVRAFLDPTMTVTAPCKDYRAGENG